MILEKFKKLVLDIPKNLDRSKKKENIPLEIIEKIKNFDIRIT